jgi:hypothetical protein
MQNLLDMHMHHMQIGAIMTFDQFLTTNKITDTVAAEKLGRDLTLIGRYRRRSVTPSPHVIADIVEWSKGKVTPRELLAVQPEVAGAA